MLYICLNRLNPETGKLGMSHSVFKKSDIRPLGKLILSVFSLLRLVQVEDGVGEDKKSMRVNNFTLINFVIKMLGPLHERTLTTIMLGIQVGFLRFTSKLLHWLYIIYLLFKVWMISCGVTILMRPPWQNFFMHGATSNMLGFFRNNIGILWIRFHWPPLGWRFLIWCVKRFFKNQNTKINDHFEQNFCSLIYNKINSSKVLNLIHIFLGN